MKKSTGSASNSKQDTLTTSIYDRMRLDILEGNLKPGGKLGMHALQEKYEAGNSPIREALNRLVPEGLVVREEKKGFKVQHLSKLELTEVIKTRCWLEDIAIRESIRHGNTEWEEAIVLALHRLSREPRFLESDCKKSSPTWEHLHVEFHMSLLAACQSKWLLFYCKHLFDLAERYRRICATVNHDYKKRDTYCEHTAIMNAAIDRKEDLAAKLIKEHYQKTGDIVVSLLPDS
jgi:DNA-binding GntR family transcriptional regulator